MMFILKLCLIAMMCSVKCNDILQRRVAQSDQLSKALSAIIEIFYSKKGANFHIIRAADAVNNDLLDDIISDLLRKVSNSDVTSEIEDYQELQTVNGRKRFSVIIIIDSLESFNRFFAMVSHDNFKLRRFFTIVAIKRLEIYEVDSIFNSFWKMLLLNVNLIMNSDLAHIDLLTFIPFNNKTCGDTSPILINQFDMNRMEWKHGQFHARKTRNLFGCLIRIGVAVGTSDPFTIAKNDSKGNVEVSGIEKDIFEELGKLLNFRIKFKIYGSFPGLLYENGTATGWIKFNIYLKNIFEEMSSFLWVCRSDESCN